ncbi:MAG TPA: MBL fold metallo-hydrolase [Anaerolineales bacterium]|nr:MBL fold metallo-hydrolase [Anaerolineales bacterium]
MILTIHRGSKQIGGSCVELRSASGERILLDVGMPLTQPDGSDWPRGTMTRPGEELRREGVLPGIDGLYSGSTPEVSALVLSHAHLDHYGLAHYVHPDIPVYGSRGTIEMLRASKLFVPDASIPADLRVLANTGTVSIGSFSVRGIPVDHAAPDSRALLVEADGQRLLYSGDLRAHGRQRHLFDELPEVAGPIDVLVLEGTTVGQPQGSHGFADEADVENRLSELFRRDGGLIVVIASGQNIDRAISVYNAALASGRELVVDPYQAYVLMTLRDVCPEAPQFDWPSVRVKFIQYHVAKLKDAGFWDLACKMSRTGKATAEQLAANPRGFVYLARSSRATVDLLRYLARTARPTIVWSQWSGYLKKGGPVPNFCDENSIEPYIIHSGGHAHPEDLADLANRLHAWAVVPIHTEAAPQFADIIRNVRVVNDGEAVEVASLITGNDGEAI